jgi:hypothetical protein
MLYLCDQTCWHLLPPRGAPSRPVPPCCHAVLHMPRAMPWRRTGVDDGTNLRVAHHGEAGERGAPAGHLFVQVGRSVRDASARPLRSPLRCMLRAARASCRVGLAAQGGQAPAVCARRPEREGGRACHDRAGLARSHGACARPASPRALAHLHTPHARARAHTHAWIRSHACACTHAQDTHATCGRSRTHLNTHLRTRAHVQSDTHTHT